VLQQALIRVLPFAQTHTAGALCFASQEAAKVDAHVRGELMDSFEGMVNGGLDRTRLSWLWMEYQVRSQTRLVWVMANVDLITKKRFVPYFDRVDRPLFSAWQKYENLSRSLQDPQSDGNRKTVSYNPGLPQEKKKWAAGLAKYLLGKCVSGELKNRADIRNFLEVEMFQEVSREGPDFITVKLPDNDSYRLTGTIFREDYTYTPISRPEDPIDISALRLQLERLRTDREQAFAQRFRLPEPVNMEEELSRTMSDPESSGTDKSEIADEPVPPVVPVNQHNYSHYHDYMRRHESWRGR
jgi:hypothetical protein